MARATYDDKTMYAQSDQTQVKSSTIPFHGGDIGFLHITAHKLNDNYL